MENLDGVISNLEREISAIKPRLEVERDLERRQQLLQQLRHLESEVLRVMQQESDRLARENAYMEAHLARLNKRP